MRRRLFLLLTLLALLPACSPHGNAGGGGDWTIFRGDPSLTGYADVRIPERLQLLWSFTSGPRTVSSPVVRDGITYWADRRGRLYGVDAAGTQVFDRDLATIIEATPLIRDTVLYIGTIDGHLLAIGLGSGETLWDYATEGQISASPNLAHFRDRDAIVFGSYDSYFYCLDTGDGSLINRFESGYYLNGAAALWEDSVLFGGCDQWLRLVHCGSGVQTDSLRLDPYIPASPAVREGLAYIGDYDGNIYEIRLRQGRIASSRKLYEAGPDDSGFESVPAVDGNAIYAYTGGQQLLAMSREDGRVLWSRMLKGSPGESAPLVCRNRVIACTKSGIVSVLDKSDGSVLWEYDAGEDILGSPAVLRDRFLVLTARGTLLCFGNK